MQLTEVLDNQVFFDTVLVYNRSSKYFSLMLNLIKKKFKVQSSDSYSIKSLADLKQYESLLTTAPLFSSAWLFYIEDANVTGISSEIMDLILRSHKLVLVVGTSNYGSFMRLRNERRWKSRFVETVYASNLTKDEFDFIYGAYTSKKGSSRLSPELQTFVKKGYLREPDAVFSLLNDLREGIQFVSRADIVSKIGVGNLTPEFELLSILSSTVKTERGLNSFMKKHSTNLVELCARSKPSTLHRNMIDSCKALLSVKQLLSEGLIIAGIKSELDIPAYEDNRVNRYLSVGNKIEGIPTSKIVLLLDVLTKGKPWRTELDALGFLHLYIKTLFSKEG